MNLQTVAWFEHTLSVSKANAERERIKLTEHQRRLAYWDAENLFRERQIAEAVKRGKATFDADRFLGGFKGLL